MKKLILIFAFVTFALFSCSSSDNEALIDTNQLVGTWVLDNAKLNGNDVDSSYKIQFTSAKRAKFYYLNPTSNTTFGPDTIEEGSYSLGGSLYTITWDGPTDPGKETTQYQILELTPTILKIKSVIPNEGTLIETYLK